MVAAEQSLCETVATEALNKTVDNALDEPKTTVCYVCTKISSTSDALSTCSECCNMYHLSCHVDDEEDRVNNRKDTVEDSKSSLSDKGLNKDDENVEGGNGNQNHSAVQLLSKRDNLCPNCFALAKGNNHKT